MFVTVDDIKLNMGGVTDQAPPYKEATESYVPESYILGAPFHHIDASLSLAGELSHPPSYEEVCDTAINLLKCMIIPTMGSTLIF